MKNIYAKMKNLNFIVFLTIFSLFSALYSTQVIGNNPNLVMAAENTVNTVVHIKTLMLQKSNVYSYYYDNYGNIYKRGQSPNYFEATGSGVILTKDGYIVTNNHVVAGATEILVTLNDKRTFKAKIIGRDPATDLAVIKIAANDLKFLQFGNSDNVHLGEWVLAVGNPFNLTSTVTAGIVSAKARDIHLVGPQISSAIDSYIQTDAAVNSGNSGGALVNEMGFLIGINAAIASNTGSYTGYSFAIPSNIVKKVVSDLIQFGKVKRAYLGVQVSELTEEMAKTKQMNTMMGIFLAATIQNGAAWRAGIKPNDVLIQIDDKKINSRSELVECLGQYQPGEIAIVRVLRAGKVLNYTVKLDSDNQE